jgi:ABC-type nitrate/sulfonate/bicarbonate transport system permease component
VTSIDETELRGASDGLAAGSAIVVSSGHDDGDVTGSDFGLTMRGLLARPAFAALLGMAVLVGVWWILSETLPVHADTIATPPEAFRALWDNRETLWGSSRTTLREASLGFVAGNVIGMLLAVAFMQSKAAERAVLQLAIVTHCLPIVAVGPLLELVLNGTQPRVVMAALLVFFPTVVTVQVGLRHTDAVALEIVRVCGGKSRHQLRYVRLMTALPYVLNALQITAPLALIGAILGEFMGGSGGLGILIINAQSANEIPLTWAIAVLCTALSMLAFIAFAGLTRLLVPWAPRGRVR